MTRESGETLLNGGPQRDTDGVRRGPTFLNLFPANSE